MEKKVRRLHKISGSLLISLPKQWTDQYKLGKGSSVEIGFKEDGTLMVAPVIDDKKKRTEANIVYDKFFVRRFFKEYFSGTDIIKVIFNDKPAGEGKRKVYEFVQDSLMNVHVTEESQQGMVLQNFRMEGISVKSCFQRMGHIVSSMFESVLDDEAEGMEDKERNLTKFYYMTIRLIRQYLQEGGYVYAQDVSLIEAMDYRLASEKLERTADELKSLSANMQNDGVKDFCKKVHYDYSSVLSSFINQDFDRAIQMWDSYRKRLKEAESVKGRLLRAKDFKSMECLMSCLRILDYAKDISNLVRGKGEKEKLLKHEE
ncbi:phosphate uptake regulator PhoU [Candidatus Woesearchaeota archaeon]|nr:phosphate uptake regulator PhoU [Candidatus Woesearchaeota archaeon]